MYPLRMPANIGVARRILDAGHAYRAISRTRKWNLFIREVYDTGVARKH